MPESTARIFLKLALDGLSEATATESAKWVQVAREGDYRGYLGGARPFTFSRVHFQQMVDNIRSHPAYVAGADGVGIADVIPWDFNHASEQDPTSGDLPISGAPAQGWTLDFQIRDGADGKAQLWALTRFLDTAKTYIRAGAYQWASVAVAFNATDPETNQNKGAIVTSIALTNTPFIEGMEKLAANRFGGKGKDVAAFRRHYFESAADPTEAVAMLKDLFSLSETSTVEDVLAEVAKVAAWVAQGSTPLGVDVAGIVSSLRTILNLEALSPSAEVLQKTTDTIAALLDQAAIESGTPATPPSPGPDSGVPEPPMATAARRGKDTMDLLQILATKLGVASTNEAVVAAVDGAVHLRRSLRVTLEADGESDKAISEAADKQKETNTQVRGKLGALLKALGVEDPDGGVEKIAELMTSAAELKEVMPELESLRQKQAETEEKQVEADVDAAMASKSLDASVRDALVLLRKTSPEKFAEKFPAGAAPATTTDARLLTSLAVTPGGTPLKVQGTQIVKAGGPATAPATPLPTGPEVVNLDQYPGANPTERAMAYLSLKHEGWNNLNHDQKWTLAVNFKRQQNVVFTVPGATAH